MAEKTAKKNPTVASESTAKKATPSVKQEEKKADVKVDTKAEAKKEVAETKKVVVKKKFIQYVKKENKKKSNEAYNTQMKINKLKTSHPVFRGRFGKKNIRRKSIAKWDKWRMPHGIDLDKGLQHGFRPKIGYRGCVEVRGIHPSGYREVLVCNFNDLEKIDAKTQAAKLSATIGKRKRNEIITKANAKGIWVLN